MRNKEQILLMIVNIHLIIAKLCGNFAIIPVSSSILYQSNVYNYEELTDNSSACIDVKNNQTIVEYAIHSAVAGDTTGKAYPCFVSGWNFDNGWVQGYGSGGLPFAIVDNISVITSANVTHINYGNEMHINDTYESFSIAYNIWIDDDNYLPRTGFPKLLFSVQLCSLNFANEGYNKMGVVMNMCGYNWIILRNSVTVPDVWVWKTHNNTFSLMNCDLNEMLQYMVINYPNILPKYVISVQFGQNIVEGSGYMNNTLYSLNITNSVNLAESNKKYYMKFIIYGCSGFGGIICCCLLALCLKKMILGKHQSDDKYHILTDIDTADSEGNGEKGEMDGHEVDAGNIIDTYASLNVDTTHDDDHAAVFVV